MEISPGSDCRFSRLQRQPKQQSSVEPSKQTGELRSPLFFFFHYAHCATEWSWAHIEYNSCKTVANEHDTLMVCRGPQLGTLDNHVRYGGDLIRNAVKWCVIMERVWMKMFPLLRLPLTTFEMIFLITSKLNVLFIKSQIRSSFIYTAPILNSCLMALNI